MSLADLAARKWRTRPVPGRRLSHHRRDPRARQLALSLAVLFALAATQLIPGANPTAATVPSAELSGYPTRIVDGDTLRFGAHRVRFAGIDAPEMSTRHGEPARRHLAALVAAGAPLHCQDTGQRTHNRIVARCRTADGRDLEAAMVEAGWASDFTRFSHGRYLPAQVRAVVARRGMYAG